MNDLILMLIIQKVVLCADSAFGLCKTPWAVHIVVIDMCCVVCVHNPEKPLQVFFIRSSNVTRLPDIVCI